MKEHSIAAVRLVMLMQEDFAFYNRERTGDLMSRQTGDMDAVRHFVAYVIYAVYENVLLLIFAIIMIVYILISVLLVSLLCTKGVKMFRNLQE